MTSNCIRKKIDNLYSVSHRCIARKRDGKYMTEYNQVPPEFQKRLLFFKNQVNEQFHFLKDFNFILHKEEMGRTENFKDYFAKFTYKNGGTIVKIQFSTDIIHGMKSAFPNLKDEQLPIVDNSITCSIWDKNAYMSLHSYIQTQFPEISRNDFTIKLDASDLESEMIRIVKNYSHFFVENLAEVLEKSKIYNCHTDRFNDQVFKEINYR